MGLLRYVSARRGYDSQIIATGDDGKEYFIPFEASDVFPWPQFLSDGGVIDNSDTLDAVKARLKAAIDVAAENERLKYITGGAGQAMTYQQKSDEAKRYLATTAEGGVITPSDYPLLFAEVGITGATLADVAAVVNAAFLQWQIIGGAIEAVRLGTKAAIEAAETSEDAEAAASAVAWP